MRDDYIPFTREAHLPPSRVHWKFHGDDDGDGPSLYTGVEIEFSSCSALLEDVDLLSLILKNWGAAVVPDLGVTYEINTAPARGSAFNEQITDICGALKRCRAKQNAMCGTHIHIDARHLTHNDIRKILLTYGKFESVILRTQPVSRIYNNKFCKPLGDFALRGIRRLKLESVVPRMEEKLNPSCSDPRYRALNLTSWKRNKTIEVRLHEATLNPEDILGWAEFWSDFVSSALGKSVPAILRSKNINEFLSKKSSSYLSFRLKKYESEWGFEDTSSSRLRNYIARCAAELV